jgi:hypothetical protein
LAPPMATGAAGKAGPGGVYDKRCAMAAIESKFESTTIATVMFLMGSRLLWEA